MAAEVEVQTGQVGRTVGGGRLHLNPLADTSNNLKDMLPINQSHIIAPEPNKPVPGPKPWLTPKPFAVERNPIIKPIVAPKPRPQSTHLAGYKLELPCSPNPVQPVATGKPRPVSANLSRPASTSFKTCNMLATGQTTKPVVQPFTPAPSLGLGDPSRPTLPVPGERQKPSNLTYSWSLRNPPAAEWSGTTSEDDQKDRSISSKGGASMTRAKSLGYLVEVGKEEEEKQKPEAVVLLRQQPRASRPRPVSAIFLDSPTKTETPVPAPRWAARRPLSADLTSKFESIGLSLHRKTPKITTKDDTPLEKALPQKESDKCPRATDGEANPAVSDQRNPKTEDLTETENDEDKSSFSIKSQINVLDSLSSAGATASDLLSPVQPVPDTEAPVGVKQLIKQLTVDTTPTQSPAVKPSLKARPLPLDLTKMFSSERLPDLSSVSLSDDRHDIISKDPQRGNEESISGDQRTFVDSQEQPKKASMPEGLEAGQTFGSVSRESGPSGDVQTVRASLFENVVERRSVLMVDEGKPVKKSTDSLSSPTFKSRNVADEGTLVTAIYKDPVSPSSSLRVVHAFDTVQAVEESRAVSESVPSAQWEDKAMTLRSRRSEGSRPVAEATAASVPLPQPQPRYLRVGALQRWSDSGLEQEKAMLTQRQEPGAHREAEQEEVSAAPKRLKTLHPEEQPKPKATYFALTGQFQDPFSPVDTRASLVDLGDLSAKSALVGSPGNFQPLRRNPSLKDTFRKTSQNQIEVTESQNSHGEIRSASDRQMTEEAMEIEKKQDMRKDVERHMAKMKELEREKQRQLELERDALLEFERMKEMEKQREFERQRQKAFEMERREFEEKQRAQERQKQIELHKLKVQELQRLERERQRQQRELERQRKAEREKLREQERERQRELERQRQREEERQRELDKERQLLEIQKEKQKMEELQRIKELETQQLLEFQKQKQRERERQQQLMLLEKQRLQEKERDEAEKIRQMALEQEMLRLKEIEKERERQREIERERQKEIEREKQKELERRRQRDLERERQRLLDMERQELEKQKLRQRELEKERQKKEELERIEVEMRQLVEVEKQRQAERDRALDLEKQRLREKKEREEAERMRHVAKQQEAERQRQRERRKEEEERARLEAAPLRPQVLDIDSVFRIDTPPKSLPQRSDPATRWKEPSVRPDESYKLAILDIDSFSSQAQPSASKDLFPVSGHLGGDTGFGARLQTERDISWRVPHQTSLGISSPVWTSSPQDPWDLLSAANQPAAQPGKQTNKISPELLLGSEKQLPAPQRHWSALLDDPHHGAPFPSTEAKSSPAGVPSSAAVQQMFSRELQNSSGDAVSRRTSHGSQELNRKRSRSVCRRSAPSGGAVEAAGLSRLRSRSAHREQDRHGLVQQKQTSDGGEERRDSGETPLNETDSQYGTWETGLRTDDSLTPATPSSDSNLSPSSRKATPPQTPGGPSSLLDTTTVESVPSPSETLSFPEAPAALLDTSLLRSRAQLAKKRAPRTRPTRAPHHSAAAVSEGGAAGDWLYRDSTEPKADSKDDACEEPSRGADSSSAVAAQPQRVAMFPGMDPSALKAQLKKRGDSDSQTDGPAPTPSQISRSPKSPFLPRAARVLPPAGGKETSEEDSPQWLKELKSKKRLSQYEMES